jgi:DNA-binding response OmpR family regulator
MPTRRILVVDDDTAIRKMLKMLLVLEGFEVRTAADASEALNQTQTYLPDVVLLDYDLPDRNGLEFARELKQYCKASENIKIMMMTGTGDPTVKGQAEALGIDYLAKPFEVSELLSWIRV